MVSEIEQKQEGGADYLHTFYSDDELFGIRFGRPEDAKQLIEVYKDVYGWSYLYPFIYNEKLLKEKILNENEYWFPVERVDTEEIVGNGYLKKTNKYSVFIARLACKKAYRGRGLTGILGAICMKTLYKMHFFDGVLRLECDVRARTFNSQRFVENTGSIPFGFIPNYNNYADKRFFKMEKKKPFTLGRKEPVIMYFQPFKTFWKERSEDIYLYDNDAIFTIYNVIHDTNRRMKSDHIIVGKDSKDLQNYELYETAEDYYKAILSINGYMQEKALKHILKQYNDWNLIEWRVPTTLNGLASQKLALESGFVPVGYNPGSYFYEGLHDTILFNYYPNGINFEQFENMNLTDTSQKIVDIVLKNLKNLNF